MHQAASAECDDPWAAHGGPPSQQPGEPVPEIFIGRVPPSISKESLEAQFAPYGATNFRLLDGRGCAFCSFSTWAAAESAIEALNGLRLDSSSSEGLNVKLADAKGAPKGAKSQQNPKVFMGNIAVHATQDAVREVCQQFGEVIHVKIFSKNDSKPCAFVTFGSFSEAEVCISSLSGVEHALATDGKTLNVRFADATGKHAGGPVMQQPFGAMQLAMPTRAPHVPPAPMPFGAAGGRAAPVQRALPGSPQGMLQQSIARTSSAGGAGQKIFVGGLPESATEEFVCGMLAPFGDVVEAKVHRKPGAKPCGFVRLATAEETDNAIAVLADNGKFVVRLADDTKGLNKRPIAAIGGIHGLAGVAVRRLQ